METGGRGRASVTCCAIVPAPFKLYVKNYKAIFDSLRADICTRFLDFSDSEELKTTRLVKGCGSQLYIRCGTQLSDLCSPHEVFPSAPLLGAPEGLFAAGDGTFVRFRMGDTFVLGSIPPPLPPPPLPERLTTHGPISGLPSPKASCWVWPMGHPHIGRSEEKRVNFCGYFFRGLICKATQGGHIFSRRHSFFTFSTASPSPGSRNFSLPSPT